MRTRNLLWVTALIAAALSAAGCARAMDDRASVEKFIRDYMAAVNGGDVAGQLRLVSHDSTVTSVVQGVIWRGWDAIHSQAVDYGPIAKRVRSEMGPITVEPLGHEAALVVVPMRSVRRVASDTAFPEMEGILTEVVRRTPQGWRMVHEHFSARVPPPRCPPAEGGGRAAAP